MTAPDPDNATIAERLEALAALYDLAGAGTYSVRAYRRAAELVRTTPAPVAELVRSGRARELRGIGSSIEARLPPRCGPSSSAWRGSSAWRRSGSSSWAARSASPPPTSCAPRRPPAGSVRFPASARRPRRRCGQRSSARVRSPAAASS